MPRVHFTSHLSRHLPCPDVETSGETVKEALNEIFVQQPQLRSYLLDDRGRVRQHVMIFVDNRPLADRETLCDLLENDSKVYVMQALSGG